MTDSRFPSVPVLIGIDADLEGDDDDLMNPKHLFSFALGRPPCTVLREFDGRLTSCKATRKHLEGLPMKRTSRLLRKTISRFVGCVSSDPGRPNVAYFFSDSPFLRQTSSSAVWLPFCILTALVFKFLTLLLFSGAQKSPNVDNSICGLGYHISGFKRCIASHFCFVKQD